MIVYCGACSHEFDDNYRLTICPHNTFLANDGKNKFSHHITSHLKKVTIEQMIEALDKAGWKKKFRHVWASPKGQLFYGPAQAYRVMRTGTYYGQEI